MIYKTSYARDCQVTKTKTKTQGDLGRSLFRNKEVKMTTGSGAVLRLGDLVAHQSATARGVACVVGGVLVRELGGRWGAGRLGAALSSAASPNQMIKCNACISCLSAHIHSSKRRVQYALI
jgi:hypothetical protein